MKPNTDDGFAVYPTQIENVPYQQVVAILEDVHRKIGCANHMEERCRRLLLGVVEGHMTTVGMQELVGTRASMLNRKYALSRSQGLNEMSSLSDQQKITAILKELRPVLPVGKKEK